MKTMVTLGALLLTAVPLAASAQSERPMPGEPAPADFKVGGKTGDPLANLPSNVRLISSFGERAVISPDGKKIAFIGKAMGDAFEYDLATGKTRNLTAHMPHNGWTRVHYLPDGSYILVGTRSPAATPGETRRDRMELFWMDAQADGVAIPLEQNLFEGVAVSRISNKIAWAVNTSRKGAAMTPGSDGSSTMYVGDVVVENGLAKLVNRRAITTANWNQCVFEAQDFLAGDKGVVGPCYRGRTDGKYDTDVTSINIADGAVTKYAVPANQYAEVEGIFPDGKRTMVECSNDTHEGLELCVLELKANKPRYHRISHVLDYGNYRFSNPTVGPDGDTIAFQFAHAKDDYGAGRGILLMKGIK